MLAWLLILNAHGAEEMSVGRLRAIADRSPSVFDVFYAREAFDVDRRPSFYGSIDLVGSMTPMESRFWVPNQRVGETDKAAVLPSGVFGSVLSLGGVGAPNDDWGWRMGIDSSQVGLTADEGVAEQRQLDVPDAGWSYATTVAYVGGFHRRLGLSLTGGALFRLAPVVERIDGVPHFSTFYNDEGELDGTTYTTEGFVHAGWRPLGQVALTVDGDGVGQAIYRRPFVLPEGARLGPLLAALPALEQVRAGAFVEELVLEPRWAVLDAEVQGRREGGAPPGVDHASVQVAARLRHDDQPADLDYRERDPADIDLEVTVVARLSTWSLPEGTLTGGATEVLVGGVRTGDRGDISVGLGFAYNDYRALTLLPLPDLPVGTLSVSGGL